MSLRTTLKFMNDHPACKGRKLRSLLRYLRWQIGGRLVGGEVIHPWIADHKLIVRLGETGSSESLYCGLPEFWEMAFVLHVVSEEDLFVDVGANIGLYTILACGVRGARGVCFEPVPETYEKFLQNVRLNNLDRRVDALNIGLSDRIGELAFTKAESCINHVLADGEVTGESVRVKVDRLDAVMGERVPTIIKIDVEGFETKVIAGAEKVLQSPALHTVMMETNGSGARYGFDELALQRKLRDYGFDTYQYEPFSRQLLRVSSEGQRPLNTLFIRDQRLVSQRISRAKRIAVGDIIAI